MSSWFLISKLSTYFYRVDDDYCIKVSDFGLTRDMYATEYYRSDKLTRLPVKWMSPESLLDNFFNEKTDVVRMCMLICT